MATSQLAVHRSIWLGLGVTALMLVGCTGASRYTPASLSGGQQVPPVTTTASATTDIVVHPSKCSASTTSLSCPQILGSVRTSGLTVTAAHVHQGKKGENGPPIVTLVKQTDTMWVIPAFTFLTDAQYAAYLDGDLYVNLHTDANKGGELRAQLTP
jgi:hypothetical protein